MLTQQSSLRVWTCMHPAYWNFFFSNTYQHFKKNTEKKRFETIYCVLFKRIYTPNRHLLIVAHVTLFHIHCTTGFLLSCSILKLTRRLLCIRRSSPDRSEPNQLLCRRRFPGSMFARHCPGLPVGHQRRDGCSEVGGVSQLNQDQE